MEIEITPELLADLKDKAEKATPGPWIKDTVFPSSVITGNPDLIIGNQAEHNNIFSSALKCNADYIAAANPAVMLALIAKIEELQTDNQYLNDWAEIDKEESFKHIEFVNDLKNFLGIDDDIPRKIVCPIILQKIKELIGEKSNDQKEKGQ